ncbi:MAG: polysaccharide deacetylase family protein [Desulfomonilaceae bacterium]|nr:polysaccharide deacetylase family protein [Desulfomonilaceae bacterium]
MSTIDWTRVLLLWDPEDQARFGLKPSDFQSSGMDVLEARYDGIGSDAGLKRTILERNPHAIVFTRNDDMPGEPPIGPLLSSIRTGYTSVSAIDPSLQEEQTRACLSDLLVRHGEIVLPEPQPMSPTRRRGHGTFSLIFDLEQLGGARFAMPRLLPLLETRGIRATFFVTGFIAEIYPGLMQRIVDGGHEIGVHGATHEWLQGLSLERQIQSIRGQVDLLSAFGPIKGANFIFRMNAVSPEAVRSSGLSYFVLFRKHLFHKTRSMASSCRPRTLSTPSGDIAFLPISVETYGMKQYEIQAMAGGARRTALQEGHGHFSVLMHPFKDGAGSRMDATERLIHRLTKEMDLDSIPLSEVSLPEDTCGEPVSILYRWDGNEPSAQADSTVPERIRSWWAPVLYHSRRTENIADGLEAQGVSTVLCSDVSGRARRICVFPDRLPHGRRLCADPILRSRRATRKAAVLLEKTDSVTIGPGPLWREAVHYLIYHVPRRFHDVRTLFLRLWYKIVARDDRD